jgi:hypothetical protein
MLIAVHLAKCSLSLLFEIGLEQCIHFRAFGSLFSSYSLIFLSGRSTSIFKKQILMSQTAKKFCNLKTRRKVRNELNNTFLQQITQDYEFCIFYF